MPRYIGVAVFESLIPFHTTFSSRLASRFLRWKAHTDSREYYLSGDTHHNNASKIDVLCKYEHFVQYSQSRSTSFKRSISSLRGRPAGQHLIVTERTQIIMTIRQIIVCHLSGKGCTFVRAIASLAFPSCD